MKNLIFFLTISFSILSCSHNDNLDTIVTIVGSWKLFEIYSNSGGGTGQWSQIDNGYSYTFFSNGEFSSSRFSECTDGTYSITNNKLTLVFGCTGFTTRVEGPEGTFIEQMTFESGFLILTPTYLTCIEGCAYKFKKQ